MNAHYSLLQGVGDCSVVSAGLLGASATYMDSGCEANADMPQTLKTRQDTPLCDHATGLVSHRAAQMSQCRQEARLQQDPKYPPSVDVVADKLETCSPRGAVAV